MLIYHSFITKLVALLLTEHVQQKVCIMSHFIGHEIKMTDTGFYFGSEIP